MKFIVPLFLSLTLSPATHAGLITFNWTAASTSPVLLEGSGYWTLDEDSLLPATSKDYFAEILDFGFSWTTSYGSTTVHRGSGAMGSAYMWTDALGELTGFNICASTNPVPCEVTTPDTIQVFSGVGWGVSTESADGFNVVFGNPTVAKTFTEVPVVSSLSLFVLALLAWVATSDYRSLKPNL